MTTDRERWKKLNTLLEQVLKVAPAEREAWIADACGDDSTLRADLLDLLRFDGDKTDGFASSVARVSTRATDTWIGSSIGAYRITEKIAEGGMGVVYAGEREGADFKQRVAIKVLHSHQLDEVAQARFLVERQILATLTHPNIASLVDGGVTDNGLPFIVMEYIEGENIADYCARHQLDNASILKLVMDVCGALQYAHNQLVIHRDIKPSNILVDANGIPRLLDFGIAKLLESDGTDGERTRPESRALTPLYASPEQLGSQPVSTAADVYGVGLLLYRLLTGRLPYTPTGDHPRDIESAILSMPAEAPSNAVTQTSDHHSGQWVARQSKALRGDLDTILLTALRKEPERRYATVNALSEDLHRYLQQLPIRARGDTLTYRAGKFLSRNRLPVALASLLVASAVGLTTVYTARINAEREVATQTADFLTGLFVDTNPYKRSREGLTVAALVTTGAERVAEDQAMQPMVRARLLRTIGQVLNTVGEAEQAERLTQEALNIYHGSGNDKGRIDALTTMSAIRDQQGRYEESLELLSEAENLSTAVYGSLSLQVGRIACLAAYSNYRLGDYDAMFARGTRSLEIYERNLPEDDFGLRCPHGILGSYYQVTGEPRKALEHETYVAKLFALHANDDINGRAAQLQGIGIIHTDLGNYREAIGYYREALELRERRSGGEDRQIPLVLYSLAHTTGKLGDYEEAHRMFVRLVRMQVEQTGETHDTVAYWLNGHGDMLANLGAIDLADTALKRAMDIYEINEKPAGHFDRSVTLVGLGKVARARNSLETAEQMMRRGVEIRELTIGASHTFTQLARVDLAETIYQRGRLNDAKVLFEDALNVLDSNGDSEHPTAAQALTGLARVALDEAQPELAIQRLEQAIDMTRASIGDDHLDNVNRRLLLADALAQQGNSELAEATRLAATRVRDDITRRWQTAVAKISAEDVM
ncbi:MAG: tetratricopeptide repeat protein [Pseudomonadota bacterium]